MNFKYFNTKVLISLLILLSLIFQPITSWLENWLKQYDKLKEAAGYIDVLSTLGLIGIVLFLINNYFWKWKCFKFLIDVPNLSGRYVGALISSYKDSQGDNIEKVCVIEITQTASSIHICAFYADKGSTTLTSKSRSVSEQIEKEANNLFSLYYMYTNDPFALSTELNNHNGTTHLTYYPDIKTLEGDYYNKKGNVGTIKVQFEQEKLIGRLYQ